MSKTPAPVLLHISELSIEINGDSTTPGYRATGMTMSMLEGERIAVVGESGCGKSLTMSSIFSVPDCLPGITGGSVKFKGSTLIDVAAVRSRYTDTHQIHRAVKTMHRENYRRFAKGHIAVIFQSPHASLNPYFKIRTHFKEAITANSIGTSKDWEAVTDEWLSRLHLHRSSGILDKYPHELSGGMAQRVAIALALCVEPSLIIADEPTTSLDVELQAVVVQLLQSVQRQNPSVGVIMITHSAPIVSSFCDRMYEFKRRVPTEKDYFLSEIHSFGGTQIKRRGSQLRYPLQSKVQQPIVSLHTVGRTYPISSFFGKTKNAQILRSVNLTIEQGGSYGIVGRSGSGKSTLARILSGLDSPDSGMVRWKGEDVSHPRKQGYSRFKLLTRLLFQDPSSVIDPAMSTVDIIQEPSDVHAIASTGEEIRTRRARVCATTKVSDHVLSVPPLKLSVGEKRRISLARGLMMEPEVLVADEPTASLDYGTRETILDTLQELNGKNGITLVVVTHDLDVALHLCDTLIVLFDGSIVESIRVPESHSGHIPFHHPYSRRLFEIHQAFETQNYHAMGEETVDAGRTEGIDEGCRYRNECALFSALDPDSDMANRCTVNVPLLEPRTDGHHIACHAV